MSLIKKFNQHIPLPIRLLIVLALAISFTTLLLPPLMHTGWAIAAKLRGKAPDCPWSHIFSYYKALSHFANARNHIEPKLSVDNSDSNLGIEFVKTPYNRNFWIKHNGNMTGKALLAYLLAEHEWIAASNKNDTVQSGDIVLDCGAHVGVFTYKALNLGARTVVAIEPEPTNVECLNRNFVNEIAKGQVIVVAKGVWNKESSMTLSISDDNSGKNSMVEQETGPSITVPTTMIDTLVRELHLPRVDFIKMDIEGAEREALQGATETLHNFRPRIMLDAYHLPDDMQVLPAIIRKSHSDYQMFCGPCQETEENSGQLIPHAVFFK